MGVKLGNGKWAIKEDKLLAYNDNSGRFFNKEFDFSRGSSATYVAKDGLIKTAGLQETNLVNNGDFSELGAELVVNGNFDTDSDWNLTVGGSNATISNGKLHFNNALTGQRAQQNIGHTNGKQYKIELEIFGQQDFGKIGIFFGGNYINNNITTLGKHTFFYTPQSGNEFFIRVMEGANCSIDNVSVKQVDPNDYWTLGTGWSISGGKASCDGTQSTTSGLIQNNVFDNNKTYKLTFDLISNGQELKFWVNGSQYITSFYSSNNYVLYINTNTSGNAFFEATVNFVGSIDNISVQEIQTDTPRIDFSDSVKGALLLEPQSTNRLTYSEDFTQSIWTNARSSGATNQIIAPDGTETGYKLIDSTDNNTHLLYSTQTVTTSSVFGFSVFLKKGSLNNAFIAFGSSINQSVVFDLQNGTIVSTGSGITSSKIESFDNDWYRCSFTHTPTSTSRFYRVGTYNGNISYAGSGSDFVYCWGAQLEQQSYATSYIPTNGATATRLADLCNNSGSAQDFNSEEGVIYAEIAALANDGTYREISLNDGTTNNAVEIRYKDTDNLFQFVVRNGGAAVVLPSVALTNALEFNKIAFSYKTDDCKMYINGVEVATDTSGTMPSGLNRLSFNWGGVNPLYGKVREVQVFTEALTDEQLEKLTTI